MAAELIIDKKELSNDVLEDYANGISIGEIAKKYNLSWQNVAYYLEKQETEKTPEWLEAVKKRGIKVFDQLAVLNKKAVDMVSDIEGIIKNSSDSVKLRAFAEIRDTMYLIQDQIKTYVGIQKDVYSFYNIKRFQEEVLKAIAEESPETASRISKRLREKEQLRSLIEPTNAWEQ